jgi:pimeloyl-ACP methyl ester carboxylesterase/quercetin dioxygenase-like cupin family protein
VSADGADVRLALLTRCGAFPPLVFLHGFGSTKEDFADVTRYREFNDYRVLALDAPGCGASDDGGVAVTIETIVQCLGRVLDKFDVRRLHLVGHSMGGLAALVYARENPGRIASFVNIEGNLAPEDCFLSRQIVTHGSADPERFIAAFVARLLDSDQYSNRLYAASLEQKVRSRVVRSIFHSMVELSDTEDLLGDFVRLPCPKLFMYGEANNNLPYLQAMRAQGVWLAEIPHCGHFPMYANPPSMWRQIADFIADATGDHTPKRSGARNFYNLADETQGVQRTLASGLRSRIFVGDRVMLSVVSIEPNATSEIHRHPEEQWGVLLDGDGVRIQDGAAIAVSCGDFWQTPGGVSHAFRAGDRGARVLDIFSPPRKEYVSAESSSSFPES